MRQQSVVVALAGGLFCGFVIAAAATDPARAIASRQLPAASEDAQDLLQPIASLETGSAGAHTIAPIFVAGKLLVVTPFPHRLLFADILAEPARLEELLTLPWDARAEGGMTTGPTLPGPLAQADKLYLTTADGHVVAIDARSGREIWNSTLADIGRGEALTSPPTLAGERLLVGGGGDDFGLRGWIAALETGTGRELWRRYSTGPDADVGIGPDFTPPYSGDRSANLGVETWLLGAWQSGGGAVAGPILYDPASGLAFHGTGRPAPLNPAQREGSNKWTSGLFARDAQTGDARWFVQLNPHDGFGYGATSPSLLLDRDWEGAPRKLLLHPGANGYLYVIDRGTGTVLAADPYMPATATDGVDLSTAAPRSRPAKSVRSQAMAREICPSWLGAPAGKPALSPDNSLVFVPVRDLCMDMEARDASLVPGTPFMGANIRLAARRGSPRGMVVAWDIAARKAVWRRLETFPLMGGIVALKGGLLAYGTPDGRLNLLRAETGELVSSTHLSDGVASDPLPFRGTDGRDYLAVLSGLGGSRAAAGTDQVDVRDATAARGLARALSDLPRPAVPRGVLHVFRLP